MDEGTDWGRSAEAATCTPTARPSTSRRVKTSRRSWPSELRSQASRQAPMPSTSRRMRGSCAPSLICRYSVSVPARAAE